MGKTTEKQKALLDFIEKYQLRNGGSPTIKEMRMHFGVSSDNSILKHLNALEEHGLIKKGDTPRSIKLLNSVKERMDAAAQICSLPLLSTIPAGGPAISSETVMDRIEIGKSMVKDPETSFVLRVSGRSMEGAGIFDGDMVIVMQGKEPRMGDIVVALVDGGNTLKRFIRDGRRTYLKAENPEYEDIHPAESLEIQGVVTGLIRTY